MNLGGKTLRKLWNVPHVTNKFAKIYNKDNRQGADKASGGFYFLNFHNTYYYYYTIYLNYIQTSTQEEFFNTLYYCIITKKILLL